MANSNKIALLLINTGSPDAPTEEAVRRYLAEFLGDRRIVELPRWKWWPILHGIILRTRPKKSAERYRGVWTDEGSPLIVHTRRTAGALEAELGIPVYWSMRYGSPSTASVLDRMKADGVGRVLVMPMFAQYASQTTAACLDGVSEYQLSHVDAPAVRTIHDYHDDPAYIDALAAHVRAPIVVKADGLAAGKGVVVAMSEQEAHDAIDMMLEGHTFGNAGARVVIEDFLDGEEASFIVMVDGENILPMATSQDHKRLLDADQGPNTGGMGAYSPAPVVTPDIHAQVMREIIRPTVQGMAADGNEAPIRFEIFYNLIK